MFYWQIILLHWFHLNDDFFSPSLCVNLTKQAWQFSKKDKLGGRAMRTGRCCSLLQNVQTFLHNSQQSCHRGVWVRWSFREEWRVCVVSLPGHLVRLEAGLLFIRPAAGCWGVGGLALLLVQGPDAIQSRPGFYSLLRFSHRSWKQAEEDLQQMFITKCSFCECPEAMISVH